MYRRKTLNYKNCQTWHLHNGSCHSTYQYRHGELVAIWKGGAWSVKVILKSSLRWWIELMTRCSMRESKYSKKEIQFIPWELPVWIRLLIHKFWIPSHSNRGLFQELIKKSEFFHQIPSQMNYAKESQLQNIWGINEIWNGKSETRTTYFLTNQLYHSLWICTLHIIYINNI